MKKRLFSLLLTLCLMLSLIPFSAAAQEVRTLQDVYVNPAYADVVSESDLLALLDSHSGGTALSAGEEFSSIDAAAAYLRGELKARAENVSVTLRLAEDVEDLRALGREIYARAVAHTGVPTEGDYLYWESGGWGSRISGYYDGTAYVYTYEYSLQHYTTAAQEQEMDTLVADALSSMQLAGLSREQKVRAIYNYVCNHVTYDYEHLDDESYQLQFTAYAAMANGTAVCQGYSLLLYRLMLEEGIDCRVVTGVADGGDHGWNIVRLGDWYYFMDSTWDSGRTGHDYELRGSDNFPNHTLDAEYTTAEFRADYPISASDYVPPAPPAITAQPVDASGKLGEKVTFSITATGEGLAYQWQYSTDGGKMWLLSTSRTTTAACTLSGAARDGWLYRCIVTDQYGVSVTSNSARVTVLPAITAQPKDASGKLGDVLKFTVAATGAGLTYQWQYSTDGGNIWNASSSKSTSATCTLTSASRSGWLYRCIVTDKNGVSVTSNTAKVTVSGGLAITSQPKDASGRVGAVLKFTIAASGYGLTYKWQYSTDGGKTWKASSSKTTSATCTLAASRDGWLYRCIVTDKSGASVTSNTARVTVVPAITSQPKDASGKVGDVLKFTVSATGVGLTYKWQYSTNGGKTWNASSSKTTTATCTLTSASRNGWLYRCIVTDAHGVSITTNTARVTVK